MDQKGLKVYKKGKNRVFGPNWKILKDSFDIDHVSSFVSSIAKFENRAFTLPFDFPAVLIFFADRGGETLPTVRGGPYVKSSWKNNYTFVNLSFFFHPKTILTATPNLKQLGPIGQKT